MMKVAIFIEKDFIMLSEKPIPEVGPLDAFIRFTITIICCTDVHILNVNIL
ncbi:MAG: hypothetical protein ACMUEM_02025 [Flavobacteriales bacterium AspAUS03]